MVNTRSQVTDNQHTFMCRTDRHSDTESESSVPEVLTREQMSEFDNGNLLDYSGESERRVVNQRFTEMTRQINELTNLVLALTEKISSNEKPSSSNREGNVPNITTSNESNTRSDNVLALLQISVSLRNRKSPDRERVVTVDAQFSSKPDKTESLSLDDLFLPPIFLP